MKYKSIHSDTQKSLDNLALFVHGFPPLVDKLLASLAIIDDRRRPFFETYDRVPCFSAVRVTSGLRVTARDKIPFDY